MSRRTAARRTPARRTPARRAAPGVAAAALALVLTACSGGGPRPVAAPTGTPAAQLAGLRVLGSRPHVRGYDRDCSTGHACSFGPAWADVDHDGCDQRDDVLRTQLTRVRFKAGTNGCVVSSGSLADPYTGTTIAFVRGPDSARVQIDHVVPLALAWDLGASTWTVAQRSALANDTRRELLAVSGEANQAKGDSGPAQWLPPDRASHCMYVQRFVAVLAAYRLAVTAADRRAAAATLASCP